MACSKGGELLLASTEAAANKARKACWHKCWYRCARIGRKHAKIWQLARLWVLPGPHPLSWLLYSGASPVRATIEHARSQVRGNPLARQAARTRSRRSCYTHPDLGSRDRLSDEWWHRRRELVPGSPSAHAPPSVRDWLAKHCMLIRPKLVLGSETSSVDKAMR